MVVDATFGHRIAESERPTYEEAVLAGELVSPPAGAIGRGDAFVLSIASRADATVFSNDSFQEFHGQYTWLFDEGRLIGGKPIPGVGWVFVLRSPGARRRQSSLDAAGARRRRKAAEKSRRRKKSAPRKSRAGQARLRSRGGRRRPSGRPQQATGDKAPSSRRRRPSRRRGRAGAAASGRGRGGGVAARRPRAGQRAARRSSPS